RLHSSVRLGSNEHVFFAYDLLHREGHDLLLLPLRERRKRLERLIERSAVPCLHLVEAFDDGAALFTAVERHGLEGIVSKHREAPYRPGECRDWVKTKTAGWRAANRSGGDCSEHLMAAYHFLAWFWASAFLCSLACFMSALVRSDATRRHTVFHSFLV